MNTNKIINEKVTPGPVPINEYLAGVSRATTKFRLILVLPLIALGGSMLACSLFSGARGPDPAAATLAAASTALANQQVQEELSLLATQTMAASIPTDTPAPPSPFPSFTPPPTNTSVPPTVFPAQKPPAPVNKVKFRPGGTSAYYQYAINAGDEHIYTIRTLAGQTMILTAASPNNDVYLEVKGLEDGVQLLWPGSQVSSWLGTLPKAQTYQITLTTSNPDTYYFLTIEVPANIFFETGAYSATIEGSIEVDTRFHPDVITRVRYLARASAGQTMTVKLTSSNLDDLSVGISGKQDGQVYLRYQVKNSGGELVLPATQGYYLDVYSLSGKSTPFTLKLTIK